MGQGRGFLEECPNGGMRLHYGINFNGNGHLDKDEINSSLPLCYGADGQDTQPCGVTRDDDAGITVVVCPGVDVIIVHEGQVRSP